ncbi:MAG: porin [Rubrivivax sp.]
MKKSLLALAALTAFAGAASAQSSVTLFGIVDVSVRDVKNGSMGSIKSLSTDGNAASRLGFRGVEDLGGGLRAGFWIEGALSADNGNASGMTWQRRSTVSLMGGFGEVRLGRDYTPIFWNQTVFDPFGTLGVGSALNNWGQAGTGATTLVRANNTVGYFLPAMGGLYGQVQVAAGEGAVGNKFFGGRLGYGAGPVNVAFAYGVTEKGGTMIDDVTDWNIGGSYDLGFLTAYGQYRTSEQGSFKNSGWLMGVTVPVGAGTIKAAYSESQFKTATTSPKVTQLAFGYVYDLSKRTALYAHYAQVDNDATLRFTASTSGPSAATISGFKSTGYEVGVRHSF